MNITLKPYFTQLWLALLLSGMSMLVGSIVSSASSINIGDSYGGGIVFYIFQDGDIEFIYGETHGLIASKADISVIYSDTFHDNTSLPAMYRWSTGQFNNENTTDYALQEVPLLFHQIGGGDLSTKNILKIYPSLSYPYSAAAVAQASREGGFEDWFLPNKEELNKLYLNMSVVGGFSDKYLYWSSSQYAGYTQKFACTQDFNNGNQDGDWKHHFCKVRAIRKF